MNKKKVAFICVHNSCRSQIAEALGKHLASDVFESYSAGTETKLQINQDAVRIMKTSYGIDMEADGQYSKLIRDIPTPDIVISMGCNVGCPFIDRPFDDNWGLEDPTGNIERGENTNCKAQEKNTDNKPCCNNSGHSNGYSGVYTSYKSASQRGRHCSLGA